MFKNDIKKLRNQKRLITTRSPGVEREVENQGNLVFQKPMQKAVLQRLLVTMGYEGSSSTRVTESHLHLHMFLTESLPGRLDYCTCSLA